MKPRPRTAHRGRISPTSLLAASGLAGTAVAIALVAGPGPAATASMMKVTVKEAKVATYGEILENSSGHALYYDTANKPPSHWACTGQCLTYWPPLLLAKGETTPAAGAGVTGLSVIKSPAGRQVAWHGKPLYTFASDKAGQVTGQGIQKVWYVAQPKAPTKSAAEVTTTTSSGSGW